MNSKKYVCIAQNASLSDHFGLTTYLKNIIKFLKRDDIELLVFPLKGQNDNKNISNIYPLNGDIYTIKGNFIYSYNLFKQIRKLSDIQVIHCLYPVSSLISAVLYKLLINNNVRIIYDLRSPWIEMGIEKDLLPKKLQNFLKNIIYRFEKLLFQFVDEFIFITLELKDHYERKMKIKIDNYSIIPSGVDTEFFKNVGKSFIREKLKINPNDRIIGYVGTIQKSREMEFLLEGFHRLLKKKENIKMIFIGDGDDRQCLEQLSNDLELTKNVIFTGQIPYEDMPKYISGFDIAICHLPDIFIFRYSFPLKILEYLSCNIPVLCSNLFTHQKISKNLDNVYIYNNMIDFISKLNTDFTFQIDPSLNIYDWKEITNSIIKSWSISK